MNTYFKNQDGSLHGNGYSHIPLGHPVHASIMSEVEAGESTIDELTGLIKYKISEVKSEAISRIGAKINVIPEIDMVAAALFSYQHTWPVAGASAELLAGKEIYDYAKTKIAQSRNATKEQLEAYDAATDDGWP